LQRRPFQNAEVVAKGAQCSKFKPYSTMGLLPWEFMTDDTVEAEEMRVQFLDLDRGAEVRVLDEPGWVAV
jgi:hypothetical protein